MTKLVEPANPPTQPLPYGIGERVVSSPTVFGGVVFFPTFIPTNDICVSSGTSRLWALFYKTGSAYQEPIIGTAASGANQTVNKFGSLGEGLAFGIVVHMGSGRDGGSPFGLLINMSQGNFGDCATCGSGGGAPGPSSSIRCQCRDRSTESVLLMDEHVTIALERTIQGRVGGALFPCPSSGLSPGHVGHSCRRLLGLFLLASRWGGCRGRHEE